MVLSPTVLMMWIATWNLEWAAPGTARHDRALAHLESVGAGIVVTTEDSLHDWDRYPYRIDGGPDWGYRIVEGRRKVIAWSRAPWSDVVVFDDGACKGRFVRGRTTIDGLELHVLAVCIPWRDAHVRTGRRDRKGWDEHIEFCDALRSQIADAVADGPTVIAGDFNQRIPRVNQPIRAADALADALALVGIPTAGEQAAGRLIDHIATSEHFDVRRVVSWSNVIDGYRITDHSGAAVDLKPH